MIDIASSLSYAEFDEVKDCKTTHEMWTKLKDIYGGDENVIRAEAKSLRGHFDQMKMREDENIAKYVERFKASVSAMKASGGEIEEKTIVRKVLRTLLHIYTIRVSDIQEMRCDPNNKIYLDDLVVRLTAFELYNFDNYVPSSKVIEFAFEAKISLKKKGKKSKSIQLGNEEEELEESLDSDLEFVEALLARKYSQDRGKYKGKVPLIYFSYEEVGHIAARCPNREKKDEKKNIKHKGKKDFKNYKNFND